MIPIHSTSHRKFCKFCKSQAVSIDQAFVFWCVLTSDTIYQQIIVWNWTGYLTFASLTSLIPLALSFLRFIQPPSQPTE